MAEHLPIPPLDEFAVERPLLLVHDGVPYCVLKTPAGDVCAYVAVCSHKDRSIVPLRVKKGKLVCPHHGVTFDPATGDVIDDCGKHVPTGLPRVEIVTEPDGSHAVRARNRYRKLLSKKERKRLAQALGDAPTSAITATAESPLPDGD